MRIESSIITSLSELREIEQQRIADEHAAIERARMADIEARRAAEQARIDAEHARVRAEREALLRIEQARVDAEREARLRVEEAEAAERARAQAALEQRRLDEEMALRRAEVLQKRPRWMVAVTALALIAATGLIWFAIDSARRTNEAEQRARIEKANADAANKEKEDVQGELAKLEQELATLDATIQSAEGKLLAAQTDADRRRARDEIEEARRLKREAKEHELALKAKLWKQKREEKVIVDEKCLKNALSKECMPAK